MKLQQPFVIKTREREKNCFNFISTFTGNYFIEHAQLGAYFDWLPPFLCHECKIYNVSIE
jgi:hypothetical protein